MALPQSESFVSEEEYLKFEESSEFRHEYMDGKVLAMSGGSYAHSRITVNTSRYLETQLDDSDCETTVNTVRLKIETRRTYRYPDLMVTCGDVDFVDNRNDTIRNPVVIIEVLSPSTQVIDRNEKMLEYTQIASLQEYVLISQDQARVERFLRQASGDWLYTQLLGLDGVLDLPSIGCKLALADVYRRVTFEDEAEAE